MTPAPLTPDTLAFIRSSAERRPASRIADELGWDLPQLKRVAARFRIHLIAPEPMIQNPAVKPPVFRDAPPITADSTLEEIIEALPDRQAQVLRILSRNMDGQFIPTPDIAAMLDGENPTTHLVVQTVFAMRPRLRPTRWSIDSMRSRAGGGYRLVETRPGP